MSLPVKRSIQSPTIPADGADRPIEIEERVERAAKQVRFNDTVQIHHVYPNKTPKISKEVKKITRKADKLSEAGSYEMALQKYKSALQILSLNSNPNLVQQAQIYLDIGLVLVELERHQESLLPLQSAYAIDHGDKGLLIETCSMLGVVYFELEIYEKARDFYLETTKLEKEGSPDEFCAMERLAIIYHKLNDQDKAAECFRWLRDSVYASADLKTKIASLFPSA